MTIRKQQIIAGIVWAIVLFGASAYFLRQPIRAMIAARQRVELPPAVPASAFVSVAVPVKKSGSAPTPVVAPTIRQAPVEHSLPARFNLAVPFTSQAPEKNWDLPWQEACEEAVVLMLDAYRKGYALDIPLSKKEMVRMVAWEEAQGWGVSIPAVEMKKLIGWYSFSKLGNKEITKLGTVKIVERPTVERIKTFIASGHPVVALVDGKALPNPHYRGGGPVYHALIVRGYTEDSFITNDPGTQFGENYVYRYDELINAIHDWNGGDVPKGTPVVLVIE